MHYIGGMSWIDQHPDMAGAFAAVAEAKSVEQKLFREAMSRLGAAVHVITTATLIALLTGIAMKLRWFGPDP